MSAGNGRKQFKGMHGWDNDLLEMHPFFLARGPNFKRGFNYNGTIETVDMYPLIAKLIELNISQFEHKINGSFKRVQNLLKSGSNPRDFLIWFYGYVERVPAYILTASAVLALVFLISCIYCARVIIRAVKLRRSRKNVYKGWRGKASVELNPKCL